HLHFETPNPHIAWDSAPIEVTAKATPWPRSDRRVAGVSSFGFSGTNVHVVLEAAPDGGTGAEPETGVKDGREASVPRAPLVVPISARDAEALVQVAGRLADAVDGVSADDAVAVARTLARGRAHWEERAAIVAA